MGNSLNCVLAKCGLSAFSPSGISDEKASGDRYHVRSCPRISPDDFPHNPVSFRPPAHSPFLRCPIFPASAPTADPASVTIDQAVAIVNGPWRFTSGMTHAGPTGFDDLTWEAYTLESVDVPLTLSKAVEGAQLSGWQAHGHPGYVGYAWYRIRVDPGFARSALAILMPRYVDDAYEIYVNGQLIGAFGQFQGYNLAYTTQPKLFPIPARIIPSTGPFTLALRFRNSTFEGLPTASKHYGGLRGVPLLGAAQLLAICYELSGVKLAASSG